MKKHLFYLALCGLAFTQPLLAQNVYQSASTLAAKIKSQSYTDILNRKSTFQDLSIIDLSNNALTNDTLTALQKSIDQTTHGNIVLQNWIINPTNLDASLAILKNNSITGAEMFFSNLNNTQMTQLASAINQSHLQAIAINDDGTLINSTQSTFIQALTSNNFIRSVLWNTNNLSDTNLILLANAPDLRFLKTNNLSAPVLSKIFNPNLIISTNTVNSTDAKTAVKNNQLAAITSQENIIAARDYYMNTAANWIQIAATHLWMFTDAGLIKLTSPKDYDFYLRPYDYIAATYNNSQKAYQLTNAFFTTLTPIFNEPDKGFKVYSIGLPLTRESIAQINSAFNQFDIGKSIRLLQIDLNVLNQLSADEFNELTSALNTLVIISIKNQQGIPISAAKMNLLFSLINKSPTIRDLEFNTGLSTGAWNILLKNFISNSNLNGLRLTLTSTSDINYVIKLADSANQTNKFMQHLGLTLSKNLINQKNISRLQTAFNNFSWGPDAYFGITTLASNGNDLTPNQEKIMLNYFQHTNNYFVNNALTGAYIFDIQIMNPTNQMQLINILTHPQFASGTSGATTLIKDSTWLNLPAADKTTLISTPSFAGLIRSQTAVAIIDRHEQNIIITPIHLFESPASSLIGNTYRIMHPYTDTQAAISDLNIFANQSQ